MSAPATTLEDAIQAALATVDDPEIRRPITDLGMVRSVAVDADGVAEIGILLTVAGCPLRDKLTADITAAVGAVAGVASVRVDFGVMTAEQRQSLQQSLRGGAGGRAGHPVRPARLADPGVRGGQRQGRRRQVLGDGEPGRRAGRARASRSAWSTRTSTATRCPGCSARPTGRPRSRT